MDDKELLKLIEIRGMIYKLLIGLGKCSKSEYEDNCLLSVLGLLDEEIENRKNE